MSDITERVKKIVVEHLGVDEAKAVPEASFIDDLGADSLDTVELVMAFEEEFNIEIPDDAAEKILTLQEIEKLKNGTFEEVAEAPDPSAAYDLADKAARYELDKRKIDLDEAKTAADIAERDERLKLDSRKLDMEERRLTLDAHKMQSEREIKHKEVAVKEKAASRRKTNESRTNA